MRKDYSKLIRDKVPDIIEAAGKKFLTRRLSEDRYKRALKQKLVEEYLKYYQPSGRNKMNGYKTSA